MKLKNGIAQGGKDFDPTASPDQPEDVSHIRPAPAPGLPISEEEYKSLKEEAEHAKPRPTREKRKVSQRKTKDKKHHR